MCVSNNINHTLQDIEQRRSIRSFTDEPVCEEDLMTILRAANHAPSAHNQQSWRFIVIRGERKKALASLVNARAGDFPKAASVLLRMAARSINSAPVVVVVANTGTLINHGTELFQIEKPTGCRLFPDHGDSKFGGGDSKPAFGGNVTRSGDGMAGGAVSHQGEVLRFMGEQEGEFMAVIPGGLCRQGW